MHIHVSKCKNDKIKLIENKKKWYGAKWLKRLEVGPWGHGLE
jgi:hypothetical protein